MTTMRAARMHGYKQPLALEEIPIPAINPNQVLVKVGGAGMCRTDFQLIDGYFQHRPCRSRPLPATRSQALSTGSVPTSRLRPDFRRATPWWCSVRSGDGSCRQCHRRQRADLQPRPLGRLRPARRLSGVSCLSRYRQLIKVSGKLSPLSLAPLTDAGLTPYRGLKKLSAAGTLGPGTTLRCWVSAVSAHTPCSTPSCSARDPLWLHWPATTRSLRWQRKTAPTTPSTFAVSLTTRYATHSNKPPAGASSTPSSECAGAEESIRLALRPASDRGCGRLGRPGRQPGRHLAVPVSQPRVHPVRLVLGQFQRSQRGHRARRSGQDQGFGDAGPVRGRQRSHRCAGARRFRRTRRDRLRLTLRPTPAARSR